MQAKGLVAKNHFRILRGPTESLPLAIRSHLASQLKSGEADAFRPYLVQRVPTPEGAAWVFLDGRSVCMAQAHLGGVACTLESKAVTEGVSLGVFAAPNKVQGHPHNFRLIGLAPDGINQLKVAIGGHRRAIPVQSNLFFAASDKPILIKQMDEGQN